MDWYVFFGVPHAVILQNKGSMYYKIEPQSMQKKLGAVVIFHLSLTPLYVFQAKGFLSYSILSF